MPAHSLVSRPGRPSILRRQLGAGLLAVLLLALPGRSAGPAQAEEPPPRATAAELKAAFVFNFTRFVQWPPAPGEPEATFVIGVAGAPDVALALELVAPGRSVGASPIVVRRLAEPDWPERLPAGVQLLYIGVESVASFRRWRQLAPRAPVLTVGDSGGFWSAHGIIDLGINEERLRFRINRAAADSAGLSLSSKLLALAYELRQKDGP